MKLCYRKLSFVLVLVGCSPNNSGSDSMGDSAPYNTSVTQPHRELSSAVVPIKHRVSDAACGRTPAAASCDPDLASTCATDSDCTAGVNGRCFETGGDVVEPCSCNYDACLKDADCSSGQTCACDGPVEYASGLMNVCVSGNCRVDSDCGSEGFPAFCSPSVAPFVCGFAIQGFYCHTSKDFCVDDNDCSPPNGLGESHCIYSSVDKRWECAAIEECG